MRRWRRAFFWIFTAAFAESIFAAASGPRVILIKDIHQNVEAQTHIAETLLALQKEGPITVGVEGASGFLNFSSYWSLSHQENVRSMATAYLRGGKMLGSSYAALQHPRGARYWGVETADLYRANVRAYLDSVAQRAQVKTVLASEQLRNAAEKRRFLSPSINQFDIQQTAYLEKRISLETYILFLANARKLDKPVHIFVEAIKAGDWVGALRKFEQARLESLHPSALDTMLLEESRRLVLINKLLDYELTNQEWNEYCAGGKSVDPSLKKFEHFYELAEQRNQQMLENLLKLQTRSASASPLVLVVGGFHIEGIQCLLKERNIDCTVVTPKMTTVAGVKAPAQYLRVFQPAHNIFLAAGDGIAPDELLVPTVNSGNAFRADINMVSIRRYRPQDRDAVRAITLETAHHGGPYQAFFRSPHWLADYLIEPYMSLEPEHLFVTTVQEQVVGYLAGVFDSVAFEHQKHRRIFPKLAVSFWTTGVWLYPANWKFIFNVVANMLQGNMSDKDEATLTGYPAHMHINIRDGFRNSGIGNRLFGAFLKEVQAAKISGIHLHTMRLENRHPFFESVEFKKLESRPFTGFRYLGEPDLHYITYGIKVTERAA